MNTHITSPCSFSSLIVVGIVELSYGLPLLWWGWAVWVVLGTKLSLCMPGTLPSIKDFQHYYFKMYWLFVQIPTFRQCILKNEEKIRKAETGWIKSRLLTGMHRAISMVITERDLNFLFTDLFPWRSRGEKTKRQRPGSVKGRSHWGSSLSRSVKVHTGQRQMWRRSTPTKED